MIDCRKSHKTKAVGIITDFTIIEEREGVLERDGSFFARIENVGGEIYYVLYNRAEGLVMVRRDRGDGEWIYSDFTHAIFNGRIVEVEYRGSIVFDEE